MTTLGIDLGTANTVVCHPRRGIVLNEPSIMMVRDAARGRSRLAGWGHDAQDLVGRTPAGLSGLRPLSDGVVVELDSARTYLRAVVQAAGGYRSRVIRPRAVIGVPGGATPLERRALVEAAEQAHITRGHLLAEPIAGALGCGVDPMGRRTHMVVDIGGGTAEVTAFCYGGIVAHRSCRVAGDEMTLAVYQYLRQEHGFVVSEVAAERLKIRASVEESPSMVVQGQDAATGRARLVTVEVQEILDAVRPVVDAIISTLGASLEDLPPQAVTDVSEEGVLAFGGGALTRGLPKLLEAALGFAVRPADEPLTCVAKGAALAARYPSVLSAYGLA